MFNSPVAVGTGLPGSFGDGFDVLLQRLNRNYGALAFSAIPEKLRQATDICTDVDDGLVRQINFGSVPIGLCVKGCVATIQ